MPKRLAIFDVTPAAYAGGYERFVVALCAAACEAGWEAEVVRPPSRQFMRMVTMFGLRHRFAHIVADSGEGENLGFLKSATHVYVKNEPLDLLWLDSLAKGVRRTVGFHTPLRYPGNSVPVMLRNAIYANPFYGRLLRGARLHFLNTTDARDIVKNARANPSAIIPNGIEAQEVALDPYGDFSLLFCGRLTEQKGLDRLTWLAREGLEVLDCIGDGPMRDDLEHRFGSAARFFGTLERVEVLKALRQHSVLLMPSRWEGLPLIMLEAMSVGCIPLVSNLTMLSEVLPEGCEWLAVDYDDRAAVRTAIERLRELHALPSEWIRLRERLVERVRLQYSERRQMNELLTFIGDGPR